MALNWSEPEDGQAGVIGLERLIDKTSRDRARILWTALPDDFSAIAGSELTRLGFVKHGSLTDFYHAGFNQEWWSLGLKG